MTSLFLFPHAVPRDAGVEAWLATLDPMRSLVAPWFEVMRNCGPDVTELVHDGHPTACARGAAFAYVDGFSGHAAIGFYQGHGLDDPRRLLEGAGKRMRHVKLRRGDPVDPAALNALIIAAYRDIIGRIERGE